MDSFLDRMVTFITDNNLLSDDRTILIGISGGADSTALTLALRKLRKDLHLSLYAAHVNYNLRGNDSVEDMNYVKELCSRLNIPLFIKETAIKDRSNMEVVARKIRFDFFESVCCKCGISCIALGHNKDDVAETILMNLFRGSGISGLKGILPKNGNIIRPLLSFSRKDITTFLQQQGINDWREDKSNLNTVYTRNKIRNLILPLVRNELNPNIINTLYNNSAVYRDAHNYLLRQSVLLAEKAIIRFSSNICQIDLPVILQSSRIIVYYMLDNCMKQLTDNNYSLSYSQFDEIESIFDANGSKEVNLPDSITVRKEYNKLTILSSCDAVIESTCLTISEIETGKPVTVKYNNRKLTFHVKSLSDSPKGVRQPAPLTSDIKLSGKNIAYVDYDKLDTPLTIGKRIEGESFMPLGMKSKKRMKDFFIDEKVSKYERDCVIILRDRQKVVWIIGYRIDDRVKVDDGTKRILMISQEEYHDRLEDEKVHPNV